MPTLLRSLSLNITWVASLLTIFTSSLQEVEPLGIGATVPDVTVLSVTSEPVKLREVVAIKPTVLIFYRGGW
jgi:hypothetical protein